MMTTKYLRKRQVAERYGIHERSVDAMSKDGRLPKPHYHGSRIPRWLESELDAQDQTASRKMVTKASVARKAAESAST